MWLFDIPHTQRETSRGLMLAMATGGFALTFWAWALLGPLGSSLREELGLTAFQQAVLVAAPGAAILAVSTAFNLLGDGLNDTLDPRRTP